jgi:exopolysaccharide production protein ExoQ
MIARRPAPLGSRPFFAVPIEDLACVALFTFFAMQGSIPGIAPSSALEITGSAPTGLTTVGGIVAQAMANALILLLIVRRPRMVLRHIAIVPWAALLAVLAIASAAWSLDPLLTLRRSIPFAFAALFGLWFAARFPAPRQLAILRLAMLLLAIATIAIVVLVPSIGLDHTPGHSADWQGVFTQKNACGRMMVLATAVILFGARITASRFASLLLFLFVLAMSGSRGAWMIGAAVFFVWLVLRAAPRIGARLRLVVAVAAPLLAALLAAATMLLLSRILLLLGRDATLSGRTDIWSQVVRFIRQRPLFGYGYDAFWRGMTGPSLQIDAAVHFIVEHAHNGLLEICLELGVAGLALFLISWLLAWCRLLPFWLRGDLAPIAFPLAVLVLIALYDLDENTLLIYNGLFWPLYVAALASIEFNARDRRHAQPPARRDILSAKPTEDAALQEVS